MRDFLKQKSEIVSLYTDGGVIDRNPSPIGGTWAYCGVNAENKRVLHNGGYILKPDGRLITNNHTEQIAIILALESMPNGWSGTVYSDSKIAMNRMRGKGTNKNLPDNVIERTKAVLARLGKVKFRHVKGHPTQSELFKGYSKNHRRVSIHNVWCDEECRRQAVLGKEIFQKKTLDKQPEP